MVTLRWVCPEIRNAVGKEKIKYDAFPTQATQTSAQRLQGIQESAHDGICTKNIGKDVGIYGANLLTHPIMYVALK